MSKSPFEISMEKNRKWVNPNASNSQASIRNQIERMKNEVVLVYDFDYSGRYACSNCFERNGILQAPSAYVSNVIKNHLKSKSCSQNKEITKSHAMIVQVNAKGTIVCNFSMVYLEDMPQDSTPTLSKEEQEAEDLTDRRIRELLNALDSQEDSNKKPSNEKPKDEMMTVEEFARERFAQLHNSYGERSKLHLLVIGFGGGTYACYNCFERNGIIKSPTGSVPGVIREHAKSESCFHNEPLPKDAVIMNVNAEGEIAQPPKFVLLNDSSQSNSQAAGN